MTTIEDVRFPTAEEIEGFWAFDKMHAPRPLHPLSQDLVMATISRGFTRAQAEYDCPIVASSQAINNYFYMAFHPHPDESEVEERMSRYLGMVEKTVPLVGKRWANEWLPQIRTRNEAERFRYDRFWHTGQKKLRRRRLPCTRLLIALPHRGHTPRP